MNTHLPKPVPEEKEAEKTEQKEDEKKEEDKEKVIKWLSTELNARLLLCWESLVH
jgi:hypothetical protein